MVKEPKPTKSGDRICVISQIRSPLFVKKFLLFLFFIFLREKYLEKEYEDNDY